MWRVCWDIIPHGVNLARKGISELCAVRDVARESLYFMFLEIASGLRMYGLLQILVFPRVKSPCSEIASSLFGTREFPWTLNAWQLYVGKYGNVGMKGFLRILKRLLFFMLEKLSIGFANIIMLCPLAFQQSSLVVIRSVGVSPPWGY